LKRFIILGSTGSIGTSSLDVIARNPGLFTAVGLAAGNSAEIMAEQVERFRPEAISLRNTEAVAMISGLVGKKLPVYDGDDGILELIRSCQADAVINGLVGSAGVLPTLTALEAGMDVLLANKETMVMAGEIVMNTARRLGRRIVPIDSEMSAIYQCLKGESSESIKRLVLTASGGPFVDTAADDLAKVTVEQALKHPTWSMGVKNTIDSATMMNKGLEVIEASWLFDTPGDKIDVAIHRDSIVHSFVEYIDGSLLCQLSKPDMRLAIQYAMTDPNRVQSSFGGLDFDRCFSLTFEPPDMDRFPCLAIAYEALMRGGTAPAAMNGANERAVEVFVEGKIGFNDIPRIIRAVVDKHPYRKDPVIDDLIETDIVSKRYVEEMVSE